MNKLLLVISIACMGVSCTSADELEYEQYLVNGEAIYKAECANCHGQKGEGLRNLYPALKGNGALENSDKVICSIKNGISADKAKSSQAMPPNAKLFDLDVAQLVTYLNKEFGSNKDKITDKQVKMALDNCRD
ncbi:MAG: cytochrome c [Cytophagales bacterium]|nr:cytochrome c [Cytophagales bacterium]